MKQNVLDLQKYLNRQQDGEVLVEDGIWGPATARVYNQFVMRKRIALRKSSPWPESDDKSITAFFGPHGVEGGYTPPMKVIHTPFNMYLYGEKEIIQRRMSVHEKIAEPYQRVLDRIWDFYNKDQAALDATGYTNYFGCYNPRPMRNSSRWSKHAWGIATDHDADRNKLSSKRQDAWMPEEIFDLYETEGFMSLGRYENRDFMHLQSTKP